MDEAEPDVPGETDTTANAHAASRIIERWLADRQTSARSDPFPEMQRLLRRICDTPSLRADEVAQSILRDMALAETMEDVDEALDRLGRRTQANGGPASGVVHRRRGVRRLLRL